MHRREFLKSSALASFGLPFDPYRRVLTRPRFQANPFSLGVASGDPTQDSIVLWTRLAPDPTEASGGMEPVRVPVRWQLASDERMRRVVREGMSFATPELAHSVHVDVQGLEPSRRYWYRFIVDGTDSPIGRTKTLPGKDEQLREVRFVTCSCQHYEQGLFVAYDQMIEDDPDFVLHLGDYIYDVSFGPGLRRHETDAAPKTLDEYRRRHALYKSDRYLQAAHQNLPFIVVPDNHDALEFNDAEAWPRRAAAFQAWYEHLPLRAHFQPGSAALSIYQSLDFSDLARLYVMDTRQFRDDQMICSEQSDPDFGFGIYRPLCDGIDDPARTLLGREQEAWLERRMASSQGHWNVFATTIPFANFTIDRDEEPHVYYGSWSAYPRNRERLVQSLESLHLDNPVFLSGDIHSSWVTDVPGNRADSVVAKEFTTTSLTSDLPPPLATPIETNLENNPHVKLFEPSRRGYALHSIRRQSWTTQFRTLASVTEPKPKRIDIGPFEIQETGRAPR